MPFDRLRYPPDWPEIARRIKFERAGGRCERCGIAHGTPHPRTGRPIPLTCAHVGPTKQDTMDCRPEVLLSLCPACHLAEDRAENSAAAGRSRRARRERCGQLRLPEMPV